MNHITSSICVLTLILVVIISGCTTNSQNSSRLSKQCTPSWQCSAWNDCTNNGIQYRTCSDVNKCNNDYGKPSESQKCVPNTCPTIRNLSLSTSQFSTTVSVENNIVGDWALIGYVSGNYYYFGSLIPCQHNNGVGQNVNYYYCQALIGKANVDTSGNILNEQVDIMNITVDPNAYRIIQTTCQDIPVSSITGNWIPIYQKAMTIKKQNDFCAQNSNSKMIALNISNFNVNYTWDSSQSKLSLNEIDFSIQNSGCVQLQNLTAEINLVKNGQNIIHAENITYDTGTALYSGVKPGETNQGTFSTYAFYYMNFVLAQGLVQKTSGYTNADFILSQKGDYILAFNIRDQNNITLASAQQELGLN